MTALNFLLKRVEKAEKSYGTTKAEFDEHGHEMGIYTLCKQEESIEESKSELRKISEDLLSAKDGYVRAVIVRFES